MLTNFDIEELAVKMDIPLEGVFFKNELPKKIKHNRFYVINLEDSVDEKTNERNDGSHWVALQVNNTNNKIEPIYFDSYGALPPKDVIEFAGVKKLVSNEKDIQSIVSDVCGFYVLAFGHYINSSPFKTGIFYRDVEDFLSVFEDLTFSADFQRNEYILKMFFKPRPDELDAVLNKKIENIGL